LWRLSWHRVSPAHRPVTCNTSMIHDLLRLRSMKHECCTWRSSVSCQKQQSGNRTGRSPETYGLLTETSWTAGYWRPRQKWKTKKTFRFEKNRWSCLKLGYVHNSGIKSTTVSTNGHNIVQAVHGINSRTPVQESAKSNDLLLVPILNFPEVDGCQSIRQHVSALPSDTTTVTGDAHIGLHTVQIYHLAWWWHVMPKRVTVSTHTINSSVSYGKVITTDRILQRLDVTISRREMLCDQFVAQLVQPVSVSRRTDMLPVN